MSDDFSCLKKINPRNPIRILKVARVYNFSLQYQQLSAQNQLIVKLEISNDFRLTTFSLFVTHISLRPLCRYRKLNLGVKYGYLRANTDITDTDFYLLLDMQKRTYSSSWYSAGLILSVILHWRMSKTTKNPSAYEQLKLYTKRHGPSMWSMQLGWNSAAYGSSRWYWLM